MTTKTDRAADEALVKRAQEFLKDGVEIAETAAALEIGEKRLQRLFARILNMTPGAWRAGATETPRGDHPRVFFRCAWFDELVAAAEDDGMGPNEWARKATLDALRAKRASAGDP